MQSLTTFLAILQVVIAVFMAIAILLQDAKGDMGASFGGGSNQSLFGATGAASFLVRVTRILGLIFMINCFALTILLSRKTGRSVIDNLPTTAPAPGPVPGTHPGAAAQGQSTQQVPAAPANPATPEAPKAGGSAQAPAPAAPPATNSAPSNPSGDGHGHK